MDLSSPERGVERFDFSVSEQEGDLQKKLSKKPRFNALNCI
jgi:hypothetical protein